MTVVYACDVGSVKSGTFAWAKTDSLTRAPFASTRIDELVESIVCDVRRGASIALGFEAPLFLPVPERSDGLNTGRPGETNRSMFAQAGAAVATVAVQEAAWVLNQLRRQLTDDVKVTTDWKSDWRVAHSILLWEAFVSSTAHSESHLRDAATAVHEFLAVSEYLDEANAVTCERPLSLIAAAALWAGWWTDLSRLRLPCLVLRPSEAYSGEIDSQNS